MHPRAAWIWVSRLLHCSPRPDHSRQWGLKHTGNTTVQVDCQILVSTTVSSIFQFKYLFYCTFDENLPQNKRKVIIAFKHVWMRTKTVKSIHNLPEAASGDWLCSWDHVRGPPRGISGSNTRWDWHKHGKAVIYPTFPRSLYTLPLAPLEFPWLMMVDSSEIDNICIA